MMGCMAWAEQGHPPGVDGSSLGAPTAGNSDPSYPLFSGSLKGVV